MTDKQLSGWWLTEDENWEKRLHQMQERSKNALEKGEYVIKPPSVDPMPPAPYSPVECDADCLLCHGIGSVEDTAGHGMECPNLTAKKRAAGDD